MAHFIDMLCSPCHQCNEQYFTDISHHIFLYVYFNIYNLLHDLKLHLRIAIPAISAVSRGEDVLRCQEHAATSMATRILQGPLKSRKIRVTIQNVAYYCIKINYLQSLIQDEYILHV